MAGLTGLYKGDGHTAPQISDRVTVMQMPHWWTTN